MATWSQVWQRNYRSSSIEILDVIYRALKEDTIPSSLPTLHSSFTHYKIEGTVNPFPPLCWAKEHHENLGQRWERSAQWLCRLESSAVCDSLGNKQSSMDLGLVMPAQPAASLLTVTNTWNGNASCLCVSL
ncbi:hypothetical protein RRG08_031797 [Elysia crispata]|uniref:Uncharacterized protein n=1 Tax=Elysia crispata TaxID=231223 RepID=A0AAE1CT18_9GAST|nr:hypothetical protein RRG08_031797 [Elysia crispata]